MQRRMRRWWFMAAAMVALAGLPLPAAAQVSGSLDFGSVPLSELWLELDYPVATGLVRRSFFYGPAITLRCEEPYVEGGDDQGNFTGKRPAYYLDKGRLEETSPNSITAGLLAKELISGKMQVGDAEFRTVEPAAVPVAGDPGDTPAPTYASFATVATLEGTREPRPEPRRPAGDADAEQGRRGGRRRQPGALRRDAGRVPGGVGPQHPERVRRLLRPARDGGDDLHRRRHDHVHRGSAVDRLGARCWGCRSPSRTGRSSRWAGRTSGC